MVKSKNCSMIFLFALLALCVALNTLNQSYNVKAEPYQTEMSLATSCADNTLTVTVENGESEFQYQFWVKKKIDIDMGSDSIGKQYIWKMSREYLFVPSADIIINSTDFYDNDKIYVIVRVKEGSNIVKEIYGAYTKTDIFLPDIKFVSVNNVQAIDQTIVVEKSGILEINITGNIAGLNYSLKDEDDNVIDNGESSVFQINTGDITPGLHKLTAVVSNENGSAEQGISLYVYDKYNASEIPVIESVTDEITDGIATFTIKVKYADGNYIQPHEINNFKFSLSGEGYTGIFQSAMLNEFDNMLDVVYKVNYIKHGVYRMVATASSKSVAITDKFIWYYSGYARTAFIQQSSNASKVNGINTEPAGTEIIINAINGSINTVLATDLRYAFYREDASGWVLIKGYRVNEYGIADSTLNWKPIRPGVYNIQVRVKDVNGGSWEAAATEQYVITGDTLEGNLTIEAIDADSGTEAQVFYAGKPYILKVSYTGMPSVDVLYMFTLTSPSLGTLYLSNYSANQYIYFVPNKAERYKITARAISVNSFGFKDVSTEAFILDSEVKLKLTAPINITFDKGQMQWDNVAGADSYIVEVNGIEFSTITNSCEILRDGSQNYTVKIKAVSHDYWLQSAFSNDLIIVNTQWLDYTDVDNFYSGNYIASTTSPTSGQTSLQIVNADDITDEYASTEQLATIKNGIETSSLKWTIINLKRNADGYVFIKLDNSKLNRLSDFDYVDVRVYLSYNSSQFTFPLYIGYKYGESGSQYKVSADDKSFAGAGWHTVRITKDRLSLSINGYNGIYLSHWATAASGQELSANVYIDSITGGYQSELMLDTASDSLDLLSKLKVSAGEITGAIQVSKDGGAYTDISGYVFTPEEAGNYSIKVTVNKEGYAETEITLSVEVKEKPYYPNNEYTVSYILGEITEANILSITGFLESEILGDIMLTYDGINSQLIGFTVELSSAGLYVAEFTVRIDGYKDTNVIVNINLTELPGFTDIDNFDSGTYTAAVTSAVAGATSAQLINAENITDEYATPQQLDAIKDGINVSALKWTITNQKRNAEGYSFIRLDGTKMGATYDFDYVDVRMYISYNSGSFTAPLFIGFKHGESGSQYTVTPATSYSGTGWHTVRIPKATLQKSIAGYHGIYLTFYLNQTLSANVYVDSITGGYNEAQISIAASFDIMATLGSRANGAIISDVDVYLNNSLVNTITNCTFTPLETGIYELRFTIKSTEYMETEMKLTVNVT